MSIDPDQPAAADSAGAKPGQDPAVENAESLRQKRRFKKGGVEGEETEKSDQTIQLLSSLLQDLIAKKDVSAPPEAESKVTAKYHRLTKTGTGSPAPPPEPGAPPAPVNPAEPAPAPNNPAAAAPPLPVTFRAAPVFEPLAQARRVRSLHILYTLGALALAASAYYAGSVYGVHYTPPESQSKPAVASAPPWTDAMLSQLNQALAADQAGDLKGAQRIAAAIKKPPAAAPPGLDLYLSGLASRQEHTYDVEANLLRAVGSAPVEAAALMNERLAFNFSRARDFEKANEFFKTSSRLDPFSATLYYHWGETLRHLGRFQEAANVFRLALDRVPTGQPEVDSLIDCINFKQRLTLIEEGRDAELQADVAEQLKAPQPSGYWLLTSAAIALQHKNLAEAADSLGRAREALGADRFSALLNDYFFRAFADRKELADLFPPDPAARRAKLLPTMTYTVEP